MAGYNQGQYFPKNPEKYEGDRSKIIYRSGWELKLMRYLDANTSILSWSSEEVVIPYFYDLDGKNHRYFVDFKMKCKATDGSIKTALIEVKPRSQVNRPKEPKALTPKKKQRYMNEAATWIKNQQKWKAARAYCEERGWMFIIMDEESLGIK